ncbi:hypothetical protein F4802DRAFT_14864 [Xylaria palmicola]|nr:hypothetical protein F4802DRAFT_14864 [Xylaria palmicola]
MTNHANPQRRPNLAPLWTNYEGLSRLPSTAFRAAQAPLLSPSPMSPTTIPSPLYATPLDGLTRKRDRALMDSLGHKLSPSSVSSPKSLTSATSAEGQSPLVSKLEEVSLHLTTSGSPTSAQGDSGEGLARREPGTRDASGSATIANAFVIARSIRRQNSPTTRASRPFWEEDSPSSKSPRRLTLRAIIRPKASGRQTFLIQRNLNIEELQATASISASSKSHKNVSPSKAGRKPLPVPAKWSSSNRRLSNGLPALPQLERSSKIVSHSTDYEKLIRDPKTVPIHTQYALTYLPALATLLTSGHVRSGDIIYLPVPHAESWPQTVRYVYTGEGELTGAMRENIVYLGGVV